MHIGNYHTPGVLYSEKYSGEGPPWEVHTRKRRLAPMIEEYGSIEYDNDLYDYDTTAAALPSTTVTTLGTVEEITTSAPVPTNGHFWCCTQSKGMMTPLHEFNYWYIFFSTQWIYLS